MPAYRPRSTFAKLSQRSERLCETRQRIAAASALAREAEPERFDGLASASTDAAS